MSWKCVCKEENNPDESKVCKNCGRTKPKYLGVKLDLGSTEKMSTNQKAVWYLMIAYDHLIESDEYLKLDREFAGKLGDENYNQVAVESKMRDFKSKAESNCKKCLNILEKATSLSPDAQFENDNSFILGIPSIKSDAYFNLGSIYFRQKNYEKAIKYFQISYDSDLNQVSIYNIAMATINLSAEGGGMFGGKKKRAAMETKRDQEIDLLKKTIEFAPFSELGIKSGRMLMEDYKITEFEF